MAITMRDIMSPAPACLTAADSVDAAARAMREHGTGTVLVLTDGKLSGILTDRDVAVEVLAGNRDARTMCVGEICSRDVAALAPGDRVEAAARLVRELGVRRIPILDGSTVVGVVCAADLIFEPDGTSVLSAVAAAPPGL
jgi:CBS domain-containing protein